MASFFCACLMPALETLEILDALFRVLPHASAVHDVADGAASPVFVDGVAIGFAEFDPGALGNNQFFLRRRRILVGVERLDDAPVDLVQFRLPDGTWQKEKSSVTAGRCILDIYRDLRRQTAQDDSAKTEAERSRGESSGP